MCGVCVVCGVCVRENGMRAVCEWCVRRMQYNMPYVACERLLVESCAVWGTVVSVGGAIYCLPPQIPT